MRLLSFLLAAAAICLSIPSFAHSSEEADNVNVNEAQDSESSEPLDVDLPDLTDGGEQGQGQGAQSNNKVSNTVGRGYLIVSKSIDTGAFRFVQRGANFSVSVAVVNIGDSPAYDISVSDEWPTGLTVVEGNAELTLNELAPGVTAWNNYTVNTDEEGTLSQSRARVNYVPTLDGVIQTSLSTATQPITILGKDFFNKITNSYTFEWSVYGTLTGLSILGPLLTWLYIQQNFENGLPKSKTQ